MLEKYRIDLIVPMFKKNKKIYIVYENKAKVFIKKLCK